MGFERVGVTLARRGGGKVKAEEKSAKIITSALGFLPFESKTLEINVSSEDHYLSGWTRPPTGAYLSLCSLKYFLCYIIIRRKILKDGIKRGEKKHVAHT